ncbi:MAG: ATP-binding protein [Methanobrevibacter sp.]|nr:ATP-binding protein [Methanobrevibacter sp.]
MKKKLPIGTQSFSILRNNNYLYVDKTKYIHEMIENGRIYFLSRPRRFGKSLLLSTLEELFKGNKELFKNLYIYDKWNWNETYPVINLDFGGIAYETPEILKLSLEDFLIEIADEYNIILKKRFLNPQFSELIKKIHEKTGKKLVVLIDEYDMPIIDRVENIEIANQNRTILRDFYKVLKASDKYLRFIFLTGVSKFSKTSIFSGLNNLNDITLNKNFACICGYTHQELKDQFKDYINILKDDLSLSERQVFEKINFWYDGYSWDGKNKVYNPFSTLKLFNSYEFSDHWFDTGTPEFLINVLKKSQDYSAVLKPITIKQSRFNTFDYNNLDPITLFFQTGYLTITEKIIINDIIHYKLEFPNFEVESSLLDYLIDLNLSEKKVSERKDKIISQIEKLDNDSFQKEMKAFLARIPARIHIEREFYYQSIFLAWLYALGFEAEGETPTNTGYADMVLKEEDFIVVAEFKFSKTKKDTDQPIKTFEKMLKEATEQIQNKKYYEKYFDKKIIAIAIAFTGKQLQTQISTIE